MSKIYTKTGDKGKTSLFDGTRVYKNNPQVEAYGTVDELNSVIGVVTAELGITNQESRMKQVLVEIQSNLFEIGAELANPNAPENLKLMQQLEKHTRHLEDYIDEMTLQMPELTHFILPGGGRIAASLHLARTVSRRTERLIVTLSQQEAKYQTVPGKIIEKEILIYINRLSDVFYTMSRYANFKEGKEDTVWVSKVK